MKTKLTIATILSCVCVLFEPTFAQTRGEDNFINIIELTPRAMKSQSGIKSPTMTATSYEVENSQIQKSVFQSTIQAAIKELEGTLSGTCAKKMNVTLKIEANGKWAVASIGIGGTVEVEIMNPSFPKNCAK